MFRHTSELCTKDQDKVKKFSNDVTKNFTQDLKNDTICKDETFFKEAEFRKDFESNCLGKLNCSFRGNISEYLNKDSSCWKNDTIKTNLDLVV